MSSGGTRECPGCGADLTGTHGKRKWCSERCRKDASYSGVCRVCGGKVAYNGTATPGDLCSTCAPGEHKRWTAEAVIAAIQSWAATYGEPPTARDWNCSSEVSDADRVRQRFEDGDWPWFNTVQYVFGSWNAGIEAAGFTPREQSHRGKARHRK